MKVTHALADLGAQRVYGIACGNPDGNDADRLADDPSQKLLLNLHPVTGTRLGSQPTVSRFEHAVSPRALYRTGEALAARVIDGQRRRRRGVRRITIDLDPGVARARPRGVDRIDRRPRFVSPASTVREVVSSPSHRGQVRRPPTHTETVSGTLTCSSVATSPSAVRESTTLAPNRWPL